jgi:hypothetical protein
LCIDLDVLGFEEIRIDLQRRGRFLDVLGVGLVLRNWF